MRVLIVGSGGREHALARAIAASSLVDDLFCAPGNGGIADTATCVDIGVMDFDGIEGLCRSESIDLVVVGPEAPLAAGLVDRLEAAGIKTFGPSAAAARLEGSKGFAKDLCAAHGIPTAAYRRFAEAAPAHAYIAATGAPIVVKADGLAAGKGVILAATEAEARAATEAILGGRFGEAGNEVVIEEYLSGEEASLMVLSDGRHVLPLAAAQDHKAVGEGDTGANTGGMGAYSPAPILTEALQETVMARIVGPAVTAMAEAGCPFTGVLYAGLMITEAGPMLLEFNVRFGDPETQAVLPRLRSDIVPALLAACDGVLDHVDLRWRDEAALAVVMAARGYPGAYEKGSVIGNLGPAGELPEVTIFHAGTALEDGRIRAAGGRVLNVAALGATLGEARERAYAAVDVIDWPQGFCRRDIGWRALRDSAG